MLAHKQQHICTYVRMLQLHTTGLTALYIRTYILCCTTCTIHTFKCVINDSMMNTYVRMHTQLTCYSCSTYLFCVTFTAFSLTFLHVLQPFVLILIPKQLKYWSRGSVYNRCGSCECGNYRTNIHTYVP